MICALYDRMARSADRVIQPAVTAFAELIAHRTGTAAVLFYGSNLRTGSLDGVLDFYALMPGKQVDRIWPRVSYHEWHYEGIDLRAKIARMSLEKFTEACSGATLDTTIWARFVQPSALVFALSCECREEVLAALAKAVRTAGMLAAVIGPERGRESAYWTALFDATYKAEFRVEKPGRAASIVETHRDHFEGLLPLAWTALDLPYSQQKGELYPQVTPSQRDFVMRWWVRREKLGKALNLMRLAKATKTFDGAAAYGIWKLERHTGVALDRTPFREKHPILAAPGAWWEYRRKKRAAQAAHHTNVGN